MVLYALNDAVGGIRIVHRTTLLTILLLLVSLTTVWPAAAGPSLQTVGNGGFETGDLTGWTATGSVDVLTAGDISGSFSPTGTFFALLSTGPTEEANAAALRASGQATAQQVSPFDEDGANGNESDVATLSTTFSAPQAGFVCYTIVSFLTSERNEPTFFDDVMEVRLNNTPVHQQSVSQSTFVTDSPSPFPNYGFTSVSSEVTVTGGTNTTGSFFLNGGTPSVRWQVPVNAGANTLEFYVGDATDSIFDSGLLIDAVEFSATACPGAFTPPTVANSTLQISGRVFDDVNANGLRDDGDVPPPDDFIQISLLRGPLRLGSTFVDGEEGETTYTLGGLAPGSYTILFDTAFGYDITPIQNANGNANDDIDSDADPSTGEASITITGNTANVDVGYVAEVRPQYTFFETLPNQSLTASIADQDNIAGATYTLDFGPSNGTVTDFQANGTFTYVPNTDFVGFDEFFYDVNVNGNVFSRDAAILVGTILDAFSDNYSVAPNATLTVDAANGVLANDAPQLTSVVVDDDVNNGTLVLNADGSFTYTPNAGFRGSDFFLYRAVSADGQSFGFGFVEIEVGEETFAERDSYSTGINAPLVVDPTRGVLANDDPVLTVATVEREPFDGTLTLLPDGSFTYIPEADQVYSTSFSYEATSADGTVFAEGFVRITVSEIVINVPGTQTTDENTPLDIPDISVEVPQPDGRVTVELDVDDGVINVEGGLQVNAQEAETAAQQLGDTPLLVVDNGTRRVTIIGNESNVNGALETVNYSPDAGFSGTDTLEINANQGNFGAENQVVIIVNPSVGGGGGTGGGGGGATVTVSAPTGLITLFELTQLPNADVIGETPANPVEGGDVFVQILAADGSLFGSGAQIGDQFLIDAGIIHSADVFGLTFGGDYRDFRPGIQVKLCFLGRGQFYYRNAAGMPRVTQLLDSFVEGRYTCAFIPNSGIIVLVQFSGTENLIEFDDIPVGDVQELSDCMVTSTTSGINLRPEPNMNNTPLEQIRFDVTLTALRRQGEWFFVDNLGTFGWANAAFFTPQGDCGS